MKKTKIARQLGSKSQLGKRGSAGEFMQLVDKADESQELGKITPVEETRIANVDAVHRFGKKSGST